MDISNLLSGRITDKITAVPDIKNGYSSEELFEFVRDFRSCQNIRQKIYKSIAWYIIYQGIVRAAAYP